MLRISKLADYAIIILGHLAAESRGIVSAAGIARAIHLGLPTVSKILKFLAEASLVISFRGPEGGYQLARQAEEITVAEILSAIEGELALTECCAVSNSCVLDSMCTLKANWRMINKTVFSFLTQVTLQDMAQPLATNALSLPGIAVTIKV
jgi:FeS assembly SUF system regulator